MRRKVLLLLLISLLIFSIKAELNQLRIVGQAEKTSDIVPARYETVNRERAACIIFVTDLAVDLDFRPRIDLVGLANPASGQFHVYVDPAERVIDVHALGYRPLPVVLREYGASSLRSGDVYKLELTGDKADERNTLLVVINVTPDHAKMTVGGIDFISGRPQQLPLGENEVVIEREGYRPIRETITVNSGNIQFNYTLQQIDPVLVRFRSNPANAAIIIDNAERGVTNRDLWLYPGSYEVQLLLSNYLTLNKVIEVKDKTDNTFSWNLQKNAGTLNVSVTPAGAELFLNNEKYESVRALELPPGLYRLEAKATGYHSESDRIEIKLGETVNKSYELKAMTGNLLLEVFPTNAEIEIVLRGSVVQKVTGSSRSPDLYIGNYTLIANASGYKSREYNVTIKENETLRQEITLEEGSDFKQGLIEMVFVQGGTFDMGTASNRNGKVTLSDFYIGKYEVTQKQWQDVMGNWDSDPHGWGSAGIGDNHPVYYVSWYDAIEFCNKLSIREGLTPVYSINGDTSPSDWSSGTIVADWSANGYRLPTESEWEYAARGGNKSRGFTYSGSNNIEEVAWYMVNSGEDRIDAGKWTSERVIDNLDDFIDLLIKNKNTTHEAGLKRANELGIYDMSGNVWEWCWDWYVDYTSSAKTNPR